MFNSGGAVTGGSGILTPLVIQLCRIYGDMSQSSGTPSDLKAPCFPSLL
jgi:hypothetical protein